MQTQLHRYQQNLTLLQHPVAENNAKEASKRIHLLETENAQLHTTLTELHEKIKQGEDQAKQLRQELVSLSVEKKSAAENCDERKALNGVCEEQFSQLHRELAKREQENQALETERQALLIENSCLKQQLTDAARETSHAQSRLLESGREMQAKVNSEKEPGLLTERCLTLDRRRSTPSACCICWPD